MRKRRVLIRAVITCCVVFGVWSIWPAVINNEDDLVLRERRRYDTEPSSPNGLITTADVKRRKGDAIRSTSTDVVQVLGHDQEDKEIRENTTFGGFQLKCHAGSGQTEVWGREKLQKVLRDYSRVHGRGNATRVLVWMCTAADWCGGLADRLKGITYSLLLAMFSRRQLLLTWNTAEQRFLHHNALNWSTKVRRIQEYGFPLSLYRVNQGYGLDKEPSLAKKMIEYVNGPHSVVYFCTNLEPSSLISSNRSFGIQWISQGLRRLGLTGYTEREMDELVGIMFWYLFVLDQQLITKLRAVKGYLGLEGVQYVGVHVRTGFVGTEHLENSDHPKLLRHQSQWEAVLQCAICTADRYLGNNSSVFLATDSLLVKEVAAKMYGRRIKTQDIVLGHLDKLSKKPAVDGSRQPQEHSVVEGMWLDLLLLAESYVLVITDSGFGALAGFMCGVPRDRTLHGLTCSVV